MKPPSQDQIKKMAGIGVGVVVFLVIVIWYQILPFRKTIAENNNKTAAFQKTIKDDKAKIEKIKADSVKYGADTNYISFFEEQMPDPKIPPVTYFPPLIEAAFKIENSQMTNMVTRPGLTVLPNRDIGNHYFRDGWTFNVMGLSYHDFARLQAKVENENPLWEILSVTISPGSDQTKHAYAITLGTIQKRQ